VRGQPDKGVTNVSNLLPWHPRRLNDEILSSWMLRIAAGNDQSVRRLCVWLGDDQPVRALDWMAHTNPLIDSIAEAVGVEKEQVIECLPSSLHGLSRILVYRPGRASPMPWRLPVGRRRAVHGAHRRTSSGRLLSTLPQWRYQFAPQGVLSPGMFTFWAMAR
jgi:hypothetical protein